MNISTFKRLATLTHDNTNIAMTNWSKTMGLGYWDWRSLWAYKEYVYVYGGVKYTYRVGSVRTRHTKYRVCECFYNNEEVSEYKFKKGIALL